MKKIIRRLLKKYNLGIIKLDELNKLQENSKAGTEFELILSLPEKYAFELISNFRKSKSQIKQDLFVLSELGFKRNGYFVEFGATNGVNLSNTHLLEKEFGWNGILAEPAHKWLNDLKRNRNVNIETDCVWKDSNSILQFNETDNGELSTINSFSSDDYHIEERKNGNKYDVKTISLIDLLDKYNAPKVIDYLSIDTEGSEYEILSAFDFGKYQFQVITCEHNYTPLREKIFDLLTRNGYVRKFEEHSRFDDWYIYKPTSLS